MRKLIKISVFPVALLGFLWLALFSASIYTYASLTSEAVVAELRFEPLADQEYLARLRSGDFCEERNFRVLGDQWRIDAEFLKWKYWALALGLDSQYRLDRLEGRYRAVGQQNTLPTLSHDLKKEAIVDVGGVSESLGLFNFLTDASYGSSTYQDIETDQVFYVYRTQTGLITRSEEKAEPRVVETGLVVEITRACGAEPGYWQRFSVWLNDQFVGTVPRAPQNRDY